MLQWVFWAWWNLMIISNESMDFNDSKELDDPQLFDDPQVFHDQLEVWTLIIQKSSVIPPSLMVLFGLGAACHLPTKWKSKSTSPIHPVPIDTVNSINKKKQPILWGETWMKHILRLPSHIWTSQPRTHPNWGISEQLFCLWWNPLNKQNSS